MPIYEYQCNNCGNISERLFFMSEDLPETIDCIECGDIAHKIMSVNSLQTDNDVTWLPSAVKTLQPDYERPIETRGEYKKYLKDNHIACKG